MEQPQRFIVKRKSFTEQVGPGTEPPMFMYLAETQQAAIRYGAQVFGCSENEVEAVVA
jgi:hypothetical protein